MDNQISLEKKILATNDWGLVALIHDGLIHTLELAIVSIKDGNWEELNQLINKSREILTELMILFEPGTDLSTNLRNIYLYVNKIITRAEIKKDENYLEDGIKVLNPLYEAFVELEKSGDPKIITGLTYGKNDLEDHLNRDGVSFEG